jgi:hypothetical protein
MYTHEMRVKDTANAYADRFFEDALEAAENSLQYANEMAIAGKAGWADRARLLADVVIYIAKATGVA